MTIHGNFTFDGVDIRTFGNVDVVLGKPETTPAREFNVIQAAGRNGDIVLDNEKYANVNVSYWVMIRDNFETIYRNIRGFLLSRTGYCRLSDSWHPDEFYQAYVNMPIEPTTYRNGDGGSFQVTFSRKPQRFLTSGEIDIAAQFNIQYSTAPQIRSGMVAKIQNPTYFPARPKFTLRYGANNYTQAQGNGIFLALFYVVTGTSDSAVKPDAAAFKDLKSIKLWDGSKNSQDSSKPYGDLGDAVATDDLIEIDCEARTVYNRTQNVSLDRFATCFSDELTYASVSVLSSTKFLYDFPAILPTIGTDYKYSPVNARHEVVSFYPRWWTI